MTARPADREALPGKWEWLTADRSHRATEELHRELQSNKQHPLFGVEVHPVAHRRDRDEFLLELDRHSKPLAIVHLTFRSETDPAWPRVWFFESFASWQEWAELPQHE